MTNGGFEDASLHGWTAEGDVAVVDASGAAHTGTRCAGGSVAVKGWSLAQADLRAAKGHTYRIDAWLRAEGSATVSLSTYEKKAKDAQRAAVWEDVAATWTPVSAYVTAVREGKLTIRFDASAAETGEAATAWIDDVSLTEVTIPTPTQVEPGKGFDDEPSMARAADGTLYVAWISWRSGRDTLQVAHFRAEPNGIFANLGAWRGDEGLKCAFLRPIARASRDGGEVEVEGEKGTALMLSCTAQGPERAPETTMHGVTGWLVPINPLATERSDGNTDVFLSRSLEATFEHRPSIRLTRAPTVDRRPTLVDKGYVQWLAYENVETPGYRVNFETARHVVVAKLDGDKLLTPKNYIATSPLWDHAESAAAAFDEKGRLWVAYRRPRPPQAGWDVYLTGWTGAAWVPPIPVSTQKGMNRTPSLVLDGNRAIVCYQADDLPNGWGDIDHAADAKSGVYIVSIPLPDVSAAPHELEPIVENPAPWEAADLRKRFGDDNPVKHSTQVAGETLRLLYGDLHSHSDTSVCERTQNGSADDVYAMQRDFLNLDFSCITDHGEDFNPYLWNRQAKLARANDVPGKFTTFLGEEWTSQYERDAKHPFGGFGHRNLILGDLGFPRWFNPKDRTSPRGLWDALRAAGANFITIPHQLADTGNVPTDWDFVDETAQPVAEVFQVRGSYEAKDAPRVARKVTPDDSYFLQGALKRGVVIGVIASPDHGGGVGKACVWAKENSREAILDAMRARRTFGTTGARIALEVRVNGHFMGEKAADGASGPVEIAVKATCPGDVAKVSICRGGAWIHEEKPTTRAFEFRFTDADAPTGPKWYYVRVEQTDGELAWSSPVWLGAAAR